MFYPTRAQMDPGSIWFRNHHDEVGAGWTGRNDRPPEAARELFAVAPRRAPMP